MLNSFCIIITTIIIVIINQLLLTVLAEIYSKMFRHLLFIT
jgi:hypothetical protein